MAEDTIDTLEIQINTQAQNAIKNLDTMISKLNQISSALKNVNAKNVGTVGTQANTSAQQVKNTSGAINTATASTEKMNNSVRRLTTNLSPLPSRMSIFGSGLRNFSQIAGRFYANCFLIIRGLKKINQATEKAMDYVETYNFFNVTIDKVAKEFKSQYSQFGYDSADEYAKSFSSRLEENLTKMTGYKVGSSGELIDTGNIGLGLDPEQLMNLQAKVTSISNSVGMVGENSVNTAKALSMLSADLSSLTNVPIASVMNNLTSGLIGQSRALYKYGVDITNNTLQQYANANGITKKLSAMSQDEKMQLRVLAILDQTRVAWGDQANTINSVANQYRIFGQQVSNLGRVLGSLFLPIVQAVLPYINGMVIALQRLLTNLGFKMWGEKWQKGIMDGISGGAMAADDGMEDLQDNLDDTGKALDKTSKKAKKLKNNLNTLGIDKLNIISKNQNTGSSGSGKTSTSTGMGNKIDLSKQIGLALKDYESVWDKALRNSQNKAEEIAKKITEAFKKGDFYSIGKYISDSLTSVLASINWNKVYSKIKDFGKGLAEFLNGLITPDLFYQLGKTIAKVVGARIEFALSFIKTFDFSNFGKSLANGINGFFENFPFEDLAEGMNAFVDGLVTGLASFLLNVNYKSVFKGFFDFFSNLEIDTLLVIPMVKGFLSLRKSAKGTGRALLTIFTKAFAKIKVLTAEIQFNFSNMTFGQGLKYSIMRVDESMTNFHNNISRTSQLMLGAFGAVAGFAGANKAIKGMLNGSKSLIKGFGQLALSITACGVALKLAFGLSNSVTAVITGVITGLGAAFAFATEKTKKYQEELNNSLGYTKKVQEENKKIAEEYKELKESQKESTEEYKGKEKEIQYAQDLWKELQSITDENGKIKKGYKDRAKVLADLINDQLGTELKVTGDILENYKKTGKEVKKIVAQKKIEAVLDTKKEDYSKAIENVNGAKDSLTKKAKEYYNSQKNVAKLQQQYTNMMNQPDVYDAQDLSDKLDEIEDAKGTRDKMKKALNDAKNTYASYSNTIKLYENALEAQANGSIGKMNNAVKELANGSDVVGSDYAQKVIDGATQKVLGYKTSEWEKAMKLKGNNLVKKFMSGFDKLDENVQENLKKGLLKGVGNLDTKEAKEKFAKRIKEIFTIKDPWIQGIEVRTEIAKNNVKKTGKSNTWSLGLTYNPFKIKGYATGGFPEDGWFRASHGELMGKFDNGKSVVANNNQITDGIEEASYRGYMRALLSQGTNNNNSSQRIETVVNLDGREIARAVNKENSRRGASIMSGNNGYLYE